LLVLSVRIPSRVYSPHMVLISVEHTHSTFEQAEK
jgi:hypothetical protein